MFIYESNEIREKVVRLSISIESSKLFSSVEYYSQETRIRIFNMKIISTRMMLYLIGYKSRKTTVSH